MCNIQFICVYCRSARVIWMFAKATAAGVATITLYYFFFVIRLKNGCLLVVNPVGLLQIMNTC